jgi:hypothetical protein
MTTIAKAVETAKSGELKPTKSPVARVAETTRVVCELGMPPVLKSWVQSQRRLMR